MTSRKDRAPLLLTAGFLLPVIAMSTLWLRHPAHASVTGPSHVGMYSVADPDGDGEALLEHWADPKDIHEQRVQIGGMLVFFGGIGTLALRRRAVLRRNARAQ